MSNILTIAYGTEGTTDKRFLYSIIKRTFDEVAFQCETEIDVYDPVYLQPQPKRNFVDDSKTLAKMSFDAGIHVLCLHSDADAANDNDVLNHKIKPALEAVEAAEDNLCKNLVPVVPVRMTEAWILADKELLISEIGTKMTINELGLNVNPETIADPKQLVIDALRIAQEHISNRRNKLEISELYQPLGQKLSLAKLSELPSYLKFREAVENAFKNLNYLH